MKNDVYDIKYFEIIDSTNLLQTCTVERTAESFTCFVRHPCMELTCHAISPSATNTGHFHDIFFQIPYDVIYIINIMAFFWYCLPIEIVKGIPITSVSLIFIKEKHLAIVSKQKCSESWQQRNLFSVPCFCPLYQGDVYCCSRLLFFFRIKAEWQL